MIKIGLLFPGQGSQYSGMGKSLYESSPEARDIFMRANDILGYDLMSLIDAGDMEKLTRTEYAQPAIFTYSYAIYQTILKSKKFTPSFLAGHSLGEITALACAEVLSFEDALRIVQKRGALMQQATSDGFGAMAAINGLHPVLVEEECERLSVEGGSIVVANYNSSTQVVISGARDQVELACQNLTRIGGTAIPLKVSTPFHTPLMEPANEEFRNTLNAADLHPWQWPVFSNVDARPYAAVSDIYNKLGIQMVSPVRWRETIEYMLRQGVNTFIELGPKSALTNLVKREYAHVRAYSYEDHAQELMAVLEEQIQEKRPTLVSRCLAIAVCTRNQNWDEKEYEEGVILPYKQVQALSSRLEEEGKEESTEDMKQALDMLRSVFRTKKVPLEEQRERFIQIFDETRKKMPDFQF